MRSGLALIRDTEYEWGKNNIDAGDLEGTACKCAFIVDGSGHLWL